MMNKIINQRAAPHVHSPVLFIRCVAMPSLIMHAGKPTSATRQSSGRGLQQPHAHSLKLCDRCVAMPSLIVLI